LATIFVNYGAYHRARVTALNAVSDLDSHFVELASAQATYPWHGTGDEKTITVTTLERGQYERAPKGRITCALWQHLESIDPDVVVGCGYSDLPMLGAAMWSRLKRRPYVLMFETNSWDRPRPLWQELPKQAALRIMVSGVFCGGTSHRQYLRQLGVADARIWEKYDVVDNDHFAHGAQTARATDGLRQRLGLPQSYFLYVGRFSPEKNLVRLLSAYRTYRQQAGASTRLVMVGDGPELHQLQDVAHRLNLTDVVWTGPKGISDLPAYYALARALVLPSLVEPWGLVVNEAMACGLPVIVSDRAGCAADLVHDTNGWIFDPVDTRALVQCFCAVSTLEDAKHAAMGEASRGAIASFTPEVWATNLAACVRAVADRA
jgi:glycosyltransferase involved in cell wall biosynthesis